MGGTLSAPTTSPKGKMISSSVAPAANRSREVPALSVVKDSTSYIPRMFSVVGLKESEQETAVATTTPTVSKRGTCLIGPPVRWAPLGLLLQEDSYHSAMAGRQVAAETILADVERHIGYEGVGS